MVDINAQVPPTSNSTGAGGAVGIIIKGSVSVYGKNDASIVTLGKLCANSFAHGKNLERMKCR